MSRDLFTPVIEAEIIPEDIPAHFDTIKKIFLARKRILNEIECNDPDYDSLRQEATQWKSQLICEIEYFNRAYSELREYGSTIDPYEPITPRENQVAQMKVPFLALLNEELDGYNHVIQRTQNPMRYESEDEQSSSRSSR